MKPIRFFFYAALLLGTPTIGAAAIASQAQAAAPTAPVQALYDALDKIQQTSSGNPGARAQILAPAIDQGFDLDGILRKVIGYKYESLDAATKQSLHEAFRRYTIAQYIDSFKQGSGAHFKVSPTTQPSPAGGGQIVKTSIGGSDDPDGTEIDYLMQQGTQGWRIADILLKGFASQTAAQRSEFRGTLNTTGVNGLIDQLNAKAKNFMGG